MTIISPGNPQMFENNKIKSTVKVTYVHMQQVTHVVLAIHRHNMNTMNASDIRILFTS